MHTLCKIHLEMTQCVDSCYLWFQIISDSVTDKTHSCIVIRLIRKLYNCCAYWQVIYITLVVWLRHPPTLHKTLHRNLLIVSD